MLHLQEHSNNPYPEPNQPNPSYWYLFRIQKTSFESENVIIIIIIIIIIIHLIFQILREESRRKYFNVRLVKIPPTMKIFFWIKWSNYVFAPGNAVLVGHLHSYHNMCYCLDPSYTTFFSPTWEMTCREHLYKTEWLLSYEVRSSQQSHWQLGIVVQIISSRYTCKIILPV